MSQTAVNPLHQRVETIKQQYQAIQGESAPLITIEHLLSNVSDTLYSSEFRFVLELLQNAVDSYRTDQGQPVPVQVRFELTPEMLIVSNDGQPFSEQDIERICGLVLARKVKKIGYKGIGFKSVASITDNAQIYSPGCQFEFNKSYHPDYEYVWLVIPHWIPAEKIPPFVAPDRVTFVLPFHENARRNDLFEQFANILNPKTGALLLFLEQLGQLELTSSLTDQSFKMRKRLDEASGLTVVEHSAGADAWQPLGRWLVVSHRPQQLTAAAQADYIRRRGLKIREEAGEQLDVGDTRLTLAFHLDDDNRFVRKRGPLYAFFPVYRQQSGFYFTIQADFLTTISRESLATPSPWNDWLIDNIPAAIETAIEILKQRPAYHSIIYEALPLQDSHAIEKPFRAAVRTLLDRLRTGPVILTDLPYARWVRPGEAAWLSPSLRHLLGNADLPHLLPGKRAFVAFSINSPLAKTFITSPQGLAVLEIGDPELLTFLNQPAWLQDKSVDWFARLFQYLAGRPGLAHLRNLPLLPTSAGLACANDPDVFLPSAECPATVTGTSMVDPGLPATPEVLDFLSNTFALRPVTVAGQIEAVILPALEQHGAALPEAVLAEYLAFVKQYYFQATPERDRSHNLTIRLCRALRLPSASGSWQLPAHLCLAEDEYGAPTEAGSLLAGVALDLFVRPPTDAATTAFYRWLGVQTTPAFDQVVTGLKSGAWFAQNPPDWFQQLYGYLEHQLSPANLPTLLDLPIVPVSPADGPVQLYAPAAIFLPTTDIDPYLAATFAGSEIVFAQLDFFPEPALAQRLLEKLGVTLFRPLEVVERFVINRFGAEAWPDDPLLLVYTAFALETFRREWGLAAQRVQEAFKAVVRLQTTTGQWQRPDTLYLTQAYGAPDFETLLADFDRVAFVSPAYLDLLPEPELWQTFWLDLGVRARLEVTLTQGRQNAATDLLRREPRLEPYLSAIIETALEGRDIPQLHDFRCHYLYNHVTLAWLPEIIETGDENRLALLLTLLAENWAGPQGYEQVMTVSYEKFYHQPFPLQEKPSYLAWLLKNRPVLPTSTGLKQVGREPVYRDTPAIRQLVGDGAVFLAFQPKDAHQPFIGGVLGVIWEPEQVPLEAVKAHLRRLKQNNTAVAEQGAVIYIFLAERGEVDFLEAEELIFLPATARGWWPPSHLFWDDYTERFGSLRGYVQTEPAYRALRAIFKAIGVNPGDPTPRDWADLLADLSGQPEEVALPKIWKAYEALENFLRRTPEEPAWWPDFLLWVRLLTERGDYLSPLDEAIYVADHPTWYKLLGETLPFIRLPDEASPMQFQTLLDRLGLRRLSDPRWIEVVVEPGKWQQLDPRLVQEISGNLDFIYSMIIHHYPDANYERDIRPRLEMIDADRHGFQVARVKHLSVSLQSHQPPHFRYPLNERAFYDSKTNRLYLVAPPGDATANLDEEVGLGLATLFGPFSELIVSEFMQLFKCSNLQEKHRLLDRLRIRYRQRPPAAPEMRATGQSAFSLTGEVWVGPDEVELNITGTEVISPRNIVRQVKEQGVGYWTEQEQIGRWGEQFAYRWLKEKFAGAYPNGEVAETEFGFKVTVSDQVVVDVQWLNKKQESGEAVDLRVVEQGQESYWEVKATRTLRREQPLKMSMSAWEFAREKGDAYYLLRVLGVGTPAAYLKVLQNPYKLWQEGQLSLEPLNIQLKPD